MSLSRLQTGSHYYDSEVEFRTDVAVGAFARLPLNPHFALQPEVSLAQKGVTIGHFVRDQTFVKTRYVEVPILLDYSFPLLGSRTGRGHFSAGPSLGIKVGEEAWHQTYIDDIKHIENIESNFFDSFDLGLSLGAGITFKSGWARLGFGVRFTQGILDAADEAYLEAIIARARGAAASKHQVIAFTLSVGFERGARRASP